MDVSDPETPRRKPCLPCEKFAFLKALKLSPQYAAIRKRVAHPKPVDAWREGLNHYFVFQLSPAADAPTAGSVPYALFLMSPQSDGPARALVITPDASGTHVEVESLIEPGTVQTLPLSELN